MKKEIKVQRIFEASLEEVWKLFTESKYIMQWWGPDNFTCPMAKMDFKVGGSSLVSMQAPKEFGGNIFYNLWTYTCIDPLKRIEYLQNMADSDGNKRKPTEVGMPEDFPIDVETIVTFNQTGANETEVSVSETADFGSMSHLAEIGLQQCMQKATSIFKK